MACHSSARSLPSLGPSGIPPPSLGQTVCTSCISYRCHGVRSIVRPLLFVTPCRPTMPSYHATPPARSSSSCRSIIRCRQSVFRSANNSPSSHAVFSSQYLHPGDPILPDHTSMTLTTILSPPLATSMVNYYREWDGPPPHAPLVL
jgi:hypothetical protein